MLLRKLSSDQSKYIEKDLESSEPHLLAACSQVLHLHMGRRRACWIVKFAWYHGDAAGLVVWRSWF